MGWTFRSATEVLIKSRWGWVTIDVASVSNLTLVLSFKSSSTQVDCSSGSATLYSCIIIIIRIIYHVAQASAVEAVAAPSPCAGTHGVMPVTLNIVHRKWRFHHRKNGGFMTFTREILVQWESTSNIISEKKWDFARYASEKGHST